MNTKTFIYAESVEVSSPNGKFVARVAEAVEYAMGSETYGRLIMMESTATIESITSLTIAIQILSGQMIRKCWQCRSEPGRKGSGLCSSLFPGDTRSM
jgi:hypothetical protein